MPFVMGGQQVHTRFVLKVPTFQTLQASEKWAHLKKEINSYLGKTHHHNTIQCSLDSYC